MEQSSQIQKIGKTVFIVFLFYLSIETLKENELFILSGVNLNIHEAGHPIFHIFFGEFIGFLGGTLMQLIVPAAFSIYFLLRQEFYSSLVMSWWLGESMIGISRYISDARAQVLPLIGGEHDWFYLLSKTKLLAYDEFIGRLVFILGTVIMLSSLCLCLYLVFKKPLNLLRAENK